MPKNILLDNQIVNIDWYKAGHVEQYHKSVRQVFSTWTPRYSQDPLAPNEFVHFGMNYFVKKYLLELFDATFFNQDIDEILKQYVKLVASSLGIVNPRTDHIKALWNLGELPLRIYSLPEGTVVPHNTPTMILTNTRPEFFWLPNYIESLMSSVLWKMGTSATTARQFRKLFDKHAKAAGETDLSFVDWQGHDFSMRGMCGPEDAARCGMGHLLSFFGTDTVPAILYAEEYYGAEGLIGGSVPATEHSVMCAGLQDGEFETFRRLLTQTYPSGIVSVVSDTWDLWKVLREYIPQLRTAIYDRPNGKLVIRPDSGDPVKILCGDPEAAHGDPAASGVLRLLAAALGLEPRDHKLPLIYKGGTIYGDGISLDRADRILGRTINELKMSPYNVVFGIGSYTYQHVTRDTHGMALKAVAYKDDKGDIIPMFKKPITDDGRKTSHKGIVAVHEGEDGKLLVQQEATEADLDNCSYQKIFEDSELLVDPKWNDVKARVRV